MNMYTMIIMNTYSGRGFGFSTQITIKLTHPYLMCESRLLIKCSEHNSKLWNLITNCGVYMCVCVARLNNESQNVKKKILRKV